MRHTGKADVLNNWRCRRQACAQTSGKLPYKGNEEKWQSSA